MYQFDFYLTKQQIEDVLPAIVEAEQKCDEGEKGTVFCQIGHSRLYSGKVMVMGSFIPGEYALRIQAILNEYYVSIGLDEIGTIRTPHND